MRFSPPLVPAVLLRRYQRFLVDVRFPDGTVAVAHCTNTGRMTGCDAPGSEVLLAPAADPQRKLRWTLVLVRVGRTWVGVDTSLPNRVVAQALRERKIAALAAYDTVTTEVPYGEGRRSRIDVLLRDSAGRLPPCFVEVKNVTLRDGTTALFPDAVSERGRKHLLELAAEAERGQRAVLVPFVARADCRAFDAAREIDPQWATTLDQALSRGVELLPLSVRFDRRGVTLGAPLPHQPRS